MKVFEIITGLITVTLLIIWQIISLVSFFCDLEINPVAHFIVLCPALVWIILRLLPEVKT